MKDEERGPVMLDKIKSQGVRELDDSAMIMRVKFKTILGEQFPGPDAAHGRRRQAAPDHRSATGFPKRCLLR